MKHLDIKRALAEHKMTQVQLSKNTGMSPQSLTFIIKGNPTVEKLMEVAKGIGCDITDLFYADEEPSTEETAANEQSTSSASTSDNDGLFSPLSPSEIEEHAINIPSPSPTIETTTFCPHCGKKVRVGVVLLPEE